MADGDGPVLATIVPVYNEAAHVEACLLSLLNQTLEPQRHMVVVLDGGSTDGTEAMVSSIIEAHRGEGWPRMELLQNPHRTVAHARNLALSTVPASVEYLVEMIGHATVSPDHLEQRLAAWEACEAEVGQRLAGVGVRVVPAEGPLSQTARWIDGALASPLGQSGGQFSRFEVRGPTKVPAFVMHRRTSVEAVGGWDVAYITSQDSDLSMRLLKAGHVLYRDPAPEVRMHKRNTLSQWWKMGHRYGFWRTKVLLKHPRRASWLEFLPLFGLLLTAGFFLASVAGWWMLPAAYGVALLVAAGQRVGQGDGWSAFVGVPLCLVMLHSSFTLGLVDGLLRRGRSPTDRG